MAVEFARAAEKLNPFVPVRVIFGREKLLGATGQQHLLKFKGGIIAKLDLLMKICRKQYNRINVIWFRLGGNETTVGQEALSTDLPGEFDPPPQSDYQSTAAPRAGTESECDLGFNRDATLRAGNRRSGTRES
jgi:hypothetical protein